MKTSNGQYTIEATIETGAINKIKTITFQVNNQKKNVFTLYSWFNSQR